MNTVTTQTPTLQLGSQGGAVKTLQQLLNQRVSRDYSVSVDGLFGAKTQAAVEIFQYSKLLRRDGIVGARTWQALQSNQQPVMPTISRGSRGEAVGIAQDVLKVAGLYQGAVDGSFGPQTEAAVRRLQGQGSLTVNGIIGSQTWTKLGGLATYLAFD